MKSERKTKSELIADLKSVRRKVKRLETLLEKCKHTQQDITERKLGEAHREAALLVSKQVEERIRESELRYQNLFDNSGSSIVIIDKDGRYLRVNNKAAKEFGRKVEEIEGKTMFDLLPHETAQKYLTINRLLIESGGHREYEDTFLMAGGEKTFLIVDQVLHDANGQGYAVQSSSIDVTERKKAEVALQESEHELHLITDNIPVFVTYASAQDLRYKFVNRFYAEAFGYSPDSILGRQVNEILGEEAFARALPYINRTRAGDRTFYENMVLIRGEKHWFDIHCEPEFDEQGIVKYIITLAFDITDRKRAEEALRNSEMRYRELFDNISSGVAIYAVKDNGEDFVFQDFNKAGERIDGDRKEDLIGRSIFQVRPGIKEFGLLDVFKRVWKTGKPEYFPANIYQDEQITNWYENFIYRLPTGEIVAVFNEITEYKKAEEELSKSHEELRMLANHLQNIREEERNHLAREFHDQLGQSMTALKMDLSLLLRTISDEKQDVQRELVAEELRSMQKLVDETSQLLWTIITELRPQMLDDLGLVATFEWEAQQFESRTGISCEFKSSAGDIQMDSKKSIALFRIYQEALTNITRHANATVVRSVLRRDNEMLVFEIKDNGRGMTFDKQSKSKSFGIIGMRERAMALGGQLEISGIAGEGTTIIVRLPL